MLAAAKWLPHAMVQVQNKWGWDVPSGQRCFVLGDPLKEGSFACSSGLDFLALSTNSAESGPVKLFEPLQVKTGAVTSQLSS